MGLRDIVSKIKSFFNKNKPKALAAGRGDTLVYNNSNLLEEITPEKALESYIECEGKINSEIKDKEKLFEKNKVLINGGPIANIDAVLKTANTMHDIAMKVKEFVISRMLEEGKDFNSVREISQSIVLEELRPFFEPIEEGKLDLGEKEEELFRNTLEMAGHEIIKYGYIGKKAAIQLKLLQTTSLDTELPEELQSIYGTTENYIKLNTLTILGSVCELLNATDEQKALLVRLVEQMVNNNSEIIPLYEDKKMKSSELVPYDTIEEKVGIKLSPQARFLLYEFFSTFKQTELSKEEHSIFISTDAPAAITYYYYDKEDGNKRTEVDGGVARAEELYSKGEPMYVSCMGEEYKYPMSEEDKKRCTRTTRIYKNGEIILPELTQEDIEHFTGLINPNSIIEDGKIINSHEELERVLEGTDKIEFGLALYSKTANELSSYGVDEETIEEIRKESAISEKYSLRYVLTPRSLNKQYEENLDMDRDTFNELEVKKIPELEKCIDQIISNFAKGYIPTIPLKEPFSKKKVPTLKEQYETVLMKAVLNGIITEFDYRNCMLFYNSMEELNKVQLSREELFKYVKKEFPNVDIISEKETPNIPKGNNEIVDDE